LVEVKAVLGIDSGKKQLLKLKDPANFNIGRVCIFSSALSSYLPMTKPSE
jgi:hypothetical protein